MNDRFLERFGNKWHYAPPMQADSITISDIIYPQVGEGSCVCIETYYYLYTRSIMVGGDNRLVSTCVFDENVCSM